MNNTPRDTAPPAVLARGLSRRFGATTAVDAIDLTVRRAEVYGFLGPNGSGKSTTMRMLCGLLAPSAGDVEVLGCVLPREAESLKRRIGYMTQKFSLYENLSVRENLEFVSGLQGLRTATMRARIDELYQQYHLGELGHRLVGTLSGGQRQRLALAAAVLHRPELLLLDEPTAAVDPESRREFWDALFDLAMAGTTLLVSTHYMDEAERCHRLAILDRGRLVTDGAPDALKQALPGSTLQVDCAQPRLAQALLLKLDHVHGVAQIGRHLRVLASDVAGEPQFLESRLRHGGIEAQVSAVAPNLEDVFVAATRRPRGYAA